MRGGPGSDLLNVSSPDSKLDQIQALLGFDGGSGSGIANSGELDQCVLVDTADTEVNDVLNVTRAVIEVASMGFDGSSYSPEQSYWVNLRNAASGTFTLELFDPVLNTALIQDIEYPISEEDLENTIQRMIIPAEEELSSCGSQGTTKCTSVVKVRFVGNDAFLVFFMGDKLYDGVTLNVTDKSLSNFAPEIFQNVTNDCLKVSAMKWLVIDSRTLASEANRFDVRSSKAKF